MKNVDPDHRRIGTVICLPRMITQHHHRPPTLDDRPRRKIASPQRPARRRSKNSSRSRIPPAVAWLASSIFALRTPRRAAARPETQPILRTPAPPPSAAETEDRRTTPTDPAGHLSRSNCRHRRSGYSRLGSATGRERSITASTSVKIAVVPPIPSASVSTAAAVKTGDIRSRRTA